MKDQMNARDMHGNSLRPSKFASRLYLFSVGVLYSLCGKGWFQILQRKQRKHVAMIERFLEETKFPQPLRREIIRNCLLTDWMDDLWGKRLMNVAPLIVEGLEHAERAQAANNGIIFVRFHQKLGTMSLPSPLAVWLNEQKFRPIHAVGARRLKETQTSEKFLNMQDLLDANKILRKGGVVQIVPDGLRGTQAVQIDFFQRKRAFRTGFAELALTSQASVLPISLQLGMDGVVVIKISPALQIPADLARDEKVTHLVSQYVEHLTVFWNTNIHMIPYHHMKKHANLEVEDMPPVAQK